MLATEALISTDLHAEIRLSLPKGPGIWVFFEKKFAVRKKHVKTHFRLTKFLNLI